MDVFAWCERGISVTRVHEVIKPLPGYVEPRDKLKVASEENFKWTYPAKLTFGSFKSYNDIVALSKTDLE